MDYTKPWFPQQPPTFKDVGFDSARKVLSQACEVMMMRVPSFGSPHPRKFFVLEDNQQILQWISPKKNPTVSRVNLRSVERIHIGIYSKTLKKHAKKLKDKEHICLSIVVDGQKNSLDVIAPDQDHFLLWLTGLQLFINDCYFKPEALISARIQYYKNVWAEIDKNMDHKVDFQELEFLMNRINLDIKRDLLRQVFVKFDSNKNGSMDFNEFKDMMDYIHHRPELNAVFETYKNRQTSLIQSQELFDFMTQVQGLRLTYEQCDALIAKVIREDQVNVSMQELGLSVTRGMDQQDFNEFLFSLTYNSCFAPEKEVVYQDMRQPLTAYFMYSSHNTYLSGHQLKGDSSVEMYKEALLQGCRCVEIDCWDGPGGQPKVTHGYTLTSSISFQSTLEAIKETAFQNSPYPVCLSLEMHCHGKQQDVIASLLISILGLENLYSLPDNLAQFQCIEDIKHFPSPEELKYKYIIKCKAPRIKLNLDGKGLTSIRLQETLLLQKSNYNSNTNYLIDEEEKVPDLNSLMTKNSIYQSKISNGVTGQGSLSLLHLNQPRISTQNEDQKTDNDLDEAREEQRLLTEELEQMEEELKELPEKERKTIKHTYQQKQSFDAGTALASLTSMISAHFKENQLMFPWEVQSLDENKIVKVAQKYGRLFWLQHHQGTFTRVYPKGIRFDSSNYDLMRGWSVGAQIVATNFQTKDEYQLLNQCLFEQNGGSKCGYVLKSPLMKGLRSEEEISDLPTKTIAIKLISGFQIPKKVGDKEIVDPFVTIELKTTSHLERIIHQETFKSKVIENNGFNPVWNESTSFDFIEEEINMLVFKVYDMDMTGSTLLCANAFNVECIRHGIRVVQMKDNRHKPCQCLLLCQFTITGK